MNINDNKLYELMNKTQELIQKKSRRRKILITGALGTAAIAAAILAFTFLNPIDVPDVVIGNSPSGGAAAESTNMVTPTPMPDGSTWDPNAGPTPVVIPSIIWDDWDETKTIDGVKITVNIDMDTIHIPPSNITSPYYETRLKKLDLDFSKKAINHFLGEEYTDPENQLKFQNVYGEGEAILEKLIAQGDFGSATPNVILMNRFDADWNSLIYHRNDTDKMYLEAYRLYDNDSGLTDDEAERVDNAAEIAQKTVEFFADDMECDFALIGYIGYRALDLNDAQDSIAYENAEKCYIFYFTKGYDGIYATFDKSPLPNIMDEEIKIPDSFPVRWDNEYMKVIVDDLGLVTFNWHNISQTASKTQSDMSVSSVETAFEIMKESVFGKAANLAKGSKTLISIFEMRFEMVRIKTEDGKSLMVPAYTFKGSETAIGPSGETIINNSRNDNANILIINALDGSIID